MLNIPSCDEIPDLQAWRHRLEEEFNKRRDQYLANYEQINQLIGLSSKNTTFQQLQLSVSLQKHHYTAASNSILSHNCRSTILQPSQYYCLLLKWPSLFFKTSHFSHRSESLRQSSLHYAQDYSRSSPSSSSVCPVFYIITTCRSKQQIEPPPHSLLLCFFLLLINSQQLTLLYIA